MFNSHLAFLVPVVTILVYYFWQNSWVLSLVFKVQMLCLDSWIGKKMFNCVLGMSWFMLLRIWLLCVCITWELLMMFAYSNVIYIHSSGLFIYYHALCLHTFCLKKVQKPIHWRRLIFSSSSKFKNQWHNWISNCKAEVTVSCGEFELWYFEGFRAGRGLTEDRSNPLISKMRKWKPRKQWLTQGYTWLVSGRVGTTLIFWW